MLRHIIVSALKRLSWLISLLSGSVESQVKFICSRIKKKKKSKGKKSHAKTMWSLKKPINLI